MKTGVLGIYDVDSNYANSLMEYISDKRGVPFKTVAFTQLEALGEFASKKEIDILLISTTAMTQEIAQLNIGKIVMLTDGKVFAEYIGYSSIYKYQSTENIIREVMNYYVDMNDNCVLNTSACQAEIIGVYSPIGRTGKTTFSLTLGQLLSMDKQTLYINMEEFSAFSRILNKVYDSDLADLMYFFKQNPESLPIKLRAVVERIQEMDYVPPLAFSEDLRNIDGDTWIALLKAIASSGAYEVIVLDLSNMVKNIFEVLEYCNCVYMPINDDKVSMYKITEFEEFLLKTDREELLNKIVKVKLPIEVDFQWDDDYLDKQVWGELGDFIRKLIREDVA